MTVFPLTGASAAFCALVAAAFCALVSAGASIIAETRSVTSVADIETGASEVPTRARPLPGPENICLVSTSVRREPGGIPRSSSEGEETGASIGPLAGPSIGRRVASSRNGLGLGLTTS
jgi:hypothetical protein